jgi:hypothetical protein
MPITGQESTLASAMTSAIKAAVEAQSGQTTQSPEYIEALCTGIANALIPFLVLNTEVDPGQSVVDDVVSTPGTIS